MRKTGKNAFEFKEDKLRRALYTILQLQQIVTSHFQSHALNQINLLPIYNSIMIIVKKSYVIFQNFNRLKICELKISAFEVLCCKNQSGSALVISIY